MLDRKDATLRTTAEPARPAIRRGAARSIWLLSDARSGSTWMAQIINHKGDFTSHFEPMHALKNPRLEGEPLIPALAPGYVPAVYLDLYREIFASGDRALVKDIHALLSAHAILEALPTSVLPVCLVRDPIEVAASKLKLDMWRWQREPEPVLAQPHLPENVRELARDPVVAASTQFEKYILVWCILYAGFRLTAPTETIYVPYSRDLDDQRKRVSEIYGALTTASAFDDAQFVTRFRQRSATDGFGLGEVYIVSEAEREFANRAVSHFGLEDLCPKTRR